MSTVKKDKNFIILLLLFIFITSVLVGLKNYQQNTRTSIQKNGKSKDTTSTTSASKIMVVENKKNNWKTYTNPTYKYTISAPPDFSWGVCEACNPPEIDFYVRNRSNTITVGVSYGSQGSLIANYSENEYTPSRNIVAVIQGKKYTSEDEVYFFEEYYNTIYKYYVFGTGPLLNNGNYTQLDIGGRYTNPEDAQLISKIIETFTFIN